MPETPLRIEWPYQAINVDEAQSNAIIVRDPLSVASKMLGYATPSEEHKKRYQPRNVHEFWAMLQGVIENEYNIQLSKIYEQTLQYQEANALQMQYLQQALMHMSLIVMNLKAELENAVKEKATPLLEDSREPMEWEWTPRSHTPLKDLIADFELEVETGGFTPKIPEQDADEKARKQRAASFPPPIPKATLEASQGTSRKRNKVTEDLPQGLGGSGGDDPPKKPNGKKRAGGSDLGDSSDNSDSDPSHNEGELPKVKITSEKLLAKYISAMIKDQQHRDKADAPKPQPYKGNPEDLERFLRQLENVWALEAHRYKKDITKIRYAANLLHRNANDKHGDLVKWYEAYHPKIDLAAARQLPGGAKATLDLVWSTWNVFAESLRASFATRVGREQVVNQWQELKHTDSIDDFLYRLTNLMWRTGYTEEVAKDKLIWGLNKEVGLAWAQTPQKPRSLHEQMALLRDIGHNLENFKVLNKTNHDP